MDSRSSDTGSHPYADNIFGDGGWMYDPAWMADYIQDKFPDYDVDGINLNAFPGNLWDAAEQNTPPLVTLGPGANAIAFNTTVEFDENSILPRRVLTPKTDGRNDVAAYSSWENGVWTLIMQRARNTGNNDDHVIHPADENYTFGFAVFQDHTQHRWHNVTFPYTLGTVGDGTDIEAKFNN